MASPPTKLIKKVPLEKIILTLIVATAFFLRVYELPTQFFVQETHNIFSGLRLHILDLFNFRDHVSENLFKSFLMCQTMRNCLAVYVSSTIYGWLNIPINEFWLRFFYVCLGTFCVVGTYLLGRQLSDYRLGLVGAAILAINSEQIHVISPNDGASALITFFSTICLIAFFYYKEHPTWVWRTVLSIILVFIVSMETLILLPLIILYQLVLFVPPENSCSKKLIGCFRYLISKENILLWLPCFLILLGHFYIYTRIGMSNLGLFGHIAESYINPNEIFVVNNFLESLVLNFRIYSYYYFNPEFFYSSLAVFFFLAINWKTNKLSEPLKILGIGFFYVFIMFVLSDSNSNQPHLYVVDTLNILFLGLIWVSLLDRVPAKGQSLVICGLSLFLMIQTIGEFRVVIKRQQLVHPLKSVGYYIHEYGGDRPTVYLLLNCRNEVTPLHNVVFMNSEFYFGTQVIDMEEEYGYPRKLFCMASKSIEETLSAYKLKDFDFYVAVYSYSASNGTENRNPHVNLRTPKIDSKVQDLLAKGVKRVAVIKHKGIKMGEIYSRRNLPFKDMEIDEYDHLWDKKYANIPGIIKTKWVGQASVWGSLWDPATGIQREHKGLP